MTTEIKTSNESTNSLANTSIFNLTWLNIKYILNNFWTALQLLSFLVAAIIVPAIFIPYRQAGAMIVILGLILPTISIMGNIGYGMRESTLFKNIKTAGYKNRNFYLPSILTIFFLQIVLSLIFMPIFWILGKTGILMSQWRVRGLSFNTLNWIVIVLWPYIIVLSTLISFSFYFLIHNIVSTQKGYFTIVLSFFILSIIFGGTLNSYFSHPEGIHDPYFRSFGGENRLSVFDDEGVQHVYYIFGQSMYDTIGISTNAHGQILDGGLFPENLFVPTMIFPFFGIGQFSSSVLGHTTFFTEYRESYLVIVSDEMFLNNTPKQIGEIISSAYELGDTTILEQVTSYNVFGNSLEIKNFFSFSFDEYHWQWTLIILQPYFTILIYFIIGAILMKRKEK